MILKEYRQNKRGRKEKRKKVSKHNSLILNIIVFTLVLLTLAFVGGDIFKSSSNGLGSLSILDNSKWVVTNQTGAEANSQIIFTNLKDKKTEICVVSNVNLGERYLYNSDGSRLLDTTNNVIKEIKWASAGCNINGTKYNGYSITLTNVQFPINQIPYVRFGNQTIVLEYQNISTVNYQYDTININATLKRCLDDRTGCGIAYPDVLIVNSSKLKFGAEDTGVTADSEYRYTFQSSNPIIQDNTDYYIETGNVIYGGLFDIGKKYSEIININTYDICSWEQSNCNFIIRNENESYYLDIYFKGQYNATSGKVFIDPQYSITSMIGTDSINTNVTVEGNFSHLTTSSVAPYDSLIGYWSFDGNNVNAKLNKTYDFSSKNNDGTEVGDALVNSTCGLYGNGLCLDSAGDYVSTSVTSPFNASLPFTISLWERTLGAGAGGLPSPFGYTSGANYSGITMQISNGGKAYCDSYPGTGTYGSRITTQSDGNLATGTWYHVVCDYNGTQMFQYVNGVLQTDTDLVNISNSGVIGQKPVIGAYFTNAASYWFNGSIDEVMIFNSTLNSTQILNIYNNQSARFVPSGTQEFLQFNSTFSHAIKIIKTTSELFGSAINHTLCAWDVARGYNNSDFDNKGGLVSYWHFDESAWTTAAGEVKDATGINNGTSAGQANTSLTNYPYSRVGVFDGNGDYINLGSNELLSVNSTISLWFNTLYISQYLFSTKSTSTNRLTVYLGSAGKFATQTKDGAGNSSIGSSSALNDAKWHHYVFIRRGDTASLSETYIDGVNVTFTIGGNVDETTNNSIGAGTTAVTYFNGSMDEVMIFNRTLTQAEITELYVKGRAKWDCPAYQSSNYFLSSQYTKAINLSTNWLYKQNQFAGTNQFYSPISFAQTNSPLTIAESPEVFNCSTLLYAGNYTLQNDVSSDGNCFTILGNNINLNGNGFTVSQTAFDAVAPTTISGSPSSIGDVYSVSPDVGGSGYAELDVIYIDGCSYGSGAVAVVDSVDGSGAVTAMTITTAGSGYYNSEYQGTCTTTTNNVGSSLTAFVSAGSSGAYNFMGFSGSLINYEIRPYKTIGGTKYFTSSGATGSLTSAEEYDNGESNISWDSATGDFDGYRITMDDVTSGYNKCVYQGNYYHDIANNVDTNYTDSVGCGNWVNTDCVGTNCYPNVASSTASGIITNGYNNLTISNITVTGFYNGISLTSSSNNQLSNITANLNTQYGIFLSSSSNNNQLSNINSNSNTQHGIYLFSSSNNNLTQITANSNTLYGILMQTNANKNNITNIITNNNKNAGIAISSASNNTVSNATTNNNTNYGIVIATGSNNIITNINANSNRLNGVLFSSTLNNIVSQGIINGTIKSAIAFTGTTATNNTIINISITNTNIAWFDLHFNTASVNGTWLIDMPYIGNYSFTGVGGTLNVKKTGLGQIKFINAVNGTGTNLSNDIQIGNNSVYVNSTKTGLNKTANVTLYNIGNRGYTTPTILRDGANCPAGICANYTSLTATDVILGVTGWSNYSIGDLVDVIAPGLSIVYPINGTTYTLNVSNLNYTTNEAGNCWYSNNSGVWNSTTTTAGTNFTNVISKEGSNTWTLYCNDSAGNLNSSSVTFFKDTSVAIVSAISSGQPSSSVQVVNISFYKAYITTSPLWILDSYNSIEIKTVGIDNKSVDVDKIIILPLTNVSLDKRNFLRISKGEYSIEYLPHGIGNLSLNVTISQNIKSYNEIINVNVEQLSLAEKTAIKAKNWSISILAFCWDFMKKYWVYSLALICSIFVLEILIRFRSKLKTNV